MSLFDKLFGKDKPEEPTHRDAKKMLQKPDSPGYYRGKHFTEYVENVKKLKQAGNLNETEKLLLKLIEATEAESKSEGCGVAPWYYHELAKICRKKKDYKSEVVILERFAKQKHATGAMPPKLIQRLEKAKALMIKEVSRK